MVRWIAPLSCIFLLLIAACVYIPKTVADEADEIRTEGVK